METYDFVISLGYNCEIANALIVGKYRDNSYPFDWLFSKMWKINQTLREQFCNFFKLENLERARYSGRPSKEKDNGFIYVHDGSFNELRNNSNLYIQQFSKYNRRTERLINLLNSEKKILFIRMNYDEKSEDYIEFVKVIKETFPNCNFTLVVILPSDKTDYQIQNENIKYLSNIKLNRFCIANYLDQNYILPKYIQPKKSY